MIHLSEDILHFVWKQGLFKFDDLETIDGQKLKIVHRGFHNHHSGPDFNEAKIRIGETLWAGQVEMHIKSSDWYLHKHERDKAYDNVILHVVYFNDLDVFIREQKVPTLVLNGRIPPQFFNKYKELLSRNNEIPCADGILSVKETIRISQWERSLTERLERKADRILEELKSQKGNWEETIFRFISMMIMGKINEQPMQWLLDIIQLKHLRSTGDQIFQKEAVLLGTAGMLEETNDDYSKKLKQEFIHHKEKLKIEPLEAYIWKYGRMRPAQFPALKLAQLASFIAKNEFIFDGILKSHDKFFSDDFLQMEASGYWKTHHHPGKSIAIRSVKLGEMQKNLIRINVIAPVLFAYGKYNDEEKWKERAIELLLTIPREKNNILRKWEELGIKSSSAFDSQALIELYNNSCIHKKCLTCHIGTNLLRHDQ